MNPSRIFIERPVATALIGVRTAARGQSSPTGCSPSRRLPQVDYPTIQVMTFYPGASPDVMASAVTAPLERQFGQLPGLNQMTLHQLRRELGHHPAVRSQPEHRRRRAGSAGRHQRLVAPSCRATYPTRPSTARSNPADAPILTLALTSNRSRLRQVEDLADTRLAQKISQMPGVGLVTISGGQKPAVRMQANPTALASYGLSLEDLRIGLAAANIEPGRKERSRRSTAEPTPSARTTNCYILPALQANHHRLSATAHPSVQRRRATWSTPPRTNRRRHG